MHLKSLTLKGFKSFASATTLKFEPGICAVVGPNGSGKSNVVDALAWVMGEQGAKTLRGNSMQDVIFAGAGSKKPLGRAEVTLTIDNHDGALPIEYREVAITRRMFRDGASEYEINGARARLLDVQELLSDSGIGREMHVIVGQGRLSQILESRPEERRAFIEEAAGVRKHRRRKDQAQRKLQGMQANLDRLEDLTGELGRQLKPLARQAEAAKKAAVLQAQVRQLRGEVAAFQLIDVAQQQRQFLEQQEAIARQVADQEQDLTQAQQQLAALEAAVAHLQPVLQNAQQQWFELSALQERVAATHRIASERVANVQETPFAGTDPQIWEQRLTRARQEAADAASEVEIAEERLETIVEQLEDATEALQAADAEHLSFLQARSDFQAGVAKLQAAEESAQQQLTRLEADIAQATQQHAQAKKALLDATAVVEDYTTQQQQLTTARVELLEQRDHTATEAKNAQQRLQEVRGKQLDGEKEVARLESRIETLQLTIQEVRPADFLAPLGEQYPLIEAIVPLPGWEKAVAVVVEQFAEGTVLPAAQQQVLDVLDQQELATTQRTVVLSAAPQENTANVWHLDIALPAGVQWLVDVVQVIPELVPACSQLWADIVVVADLAQARQVLAQEPRLRVVTKDGAFLGLDWIIFGTAQQSPIETQAAIAHAQEQLETAREQLTQGAGVLAGAQQAADAAQGVAAHAQAMLREHDHGLQTVQRELQRAQQDVQRATRQVQQADAQMQAAETRQQELHTELGQLRDRLARVEQQELPDAPDAQAREAAQAVVTQVQAMHMEARLQVRTLEERAQQATQKAQSIERQMQQEQRAAAQHEQQMRQRCQQVQAAKFVVEHASAVQARMGTTLTQLQARREVLQQKLSGQQGQLQQHKQAVQSRQHQLDALRKRLHAAELQASKVAVRLEELQEAASQQTGLPVSDILESFQPDADFDIATARVDLRSAEKSLQALGKVNPLALEEYKALEERYEYLSSQLADVHQARADLQQVIQDVDAHILQLFSDAWRDVEAEFPKVFATLFPGGEGRLVLTDPHNMETTGIDIEARPPGKRIKRLTLLSGGEKSLTALAMLVAIFRARPSPFYVMDEVEAALDDVNLRRLLALFAELREESQLIVITHQKPTMNLANVLYGVTMRGDGITQVVSQRLQRVAPAPQSADDAAEADESGMGDDTARDDAGSEATDGAAPGE